MNKAHKGDSLKDNPNFFSRRHRLTRTAKNAGFKTYGEYLDALARTRGYANAYEYASSKLKAKGLTQRSVKRRLAETQGLASSYDRALAHKRTQRKRNQQFAKWLMECLRLLGKNRTWLAKKMGISRNQVSDYSLGLFIPREDRLNDMRYIFAQCAMPQIKLPHPPKRKAKGKPKPLLSDVKPATSRIGTKR